MTQNEQHPVSRIEDLKRVRDELRVRVHLGHEEAVQEWERAEVLWSRLLGEVERFKDVSRAPATELSSAASTLAHSVGESYERIRTALHRPV